MSRFGTFFSSLHDDDAMEWTTVTWGKASCVFLRWHCVSERSHAFMLSCHVGGVSFEWDIFFVFSIAVGRCISTGLFNILKYPFRHVNEPRTQQNPAPWGRICKSLSWG